MRSYKTVNTLTVAVAAAGLAVIGALGAHAVAEQRTAGAHDEEAAMTVMPADEFDWQPAPESLPEGAHMVVTHGSPAEDRIHIIFVEAPQGYEVPMHWHPIDENVTLVDGTLSLEAEGMERQELEAGSFFTATARHPHTVRCESEEGCRFSVVGDGVFEINYVDPADDPRREEPVGLGRGDR